MTDEAWAALMRIMSPYSRRNIELLEGVDLHQPEPGAADRVQAAVEVVSVHGVKVIGAQYIPEHTALALDAESFYFVDGGDE